MRIRGGLEEVLQIGDVQWRTGTRTSPPEREPDGNGVVISGGKEGMGVGPKMLPLRTHLFLPGRRALLS
jgi:hypothetical protein